MIASVFDALGDPIRLVMVQRLSEAGPLPTGKLTEGLGITRQGAERHLRVLESAGLIKTLKAGRTSMRELDATRLLAATEWMRSRAKMWEDRLSRLAEAYRE